MSTHPTARRKSEIRMTKSETQKKQRDSREKAQKSRCFCASCDFWRPFWFSGFGLRASFGFRHSTFVFLLIALACHAAAPVPPPERLLPDDTLVLVTAPDFTRLRQVLKTSPQSQLWNDPA